MFVYDIEVYPNFFCMYIGNMERDCWYFEISPRLNQRGRMKEFLGDVYKKGVSMVGYNNLSYDWPVIDFILRAERTNKEIYDFSQSVVQRSFNKEPIYVKQYIKQIDLFKIWHFDNQARLTSLKALEFAMRMDDIQDLPYGPHDTLTEEQMERVREYNKHDMKCTAEFLKHSLDKIEMRHRFSKMIGKNMTNRSDSSLGKAFFSFKLEEQGIRLYNGKSPRQTPREELNLKDCVPDYCQFVRPEFKAIREWFERTTVKETKGALLDILDIGPVEPYANLRVKRRKIAELKKGEEPGEYEVEEGEWVDVKELKSGKKSVYACHNIMDKLNVVVEGVEYVFGMGGIHGSVQNKHIKAGNGWCIATMDIASMYPNLIIANGFYPEHLSADFCNVYRDLYEMRKRYKKGTAENADIKEALNSVFGAGNDKFSPFYDPLFAMKTTIGGQLNFALFIDRLLQIPSVRILMANTDGTEFLIHEDDVEKLEPVVKEWEQATGLQIEAGWYDQIAILNVNNYIAQGKDVKKKGCFQTNPGWHQNHSALVIPKAAEAHLLYGQDIEDFLVNHDDIFDFMYRVKVARTHRLTADGVDIQRLSRYYASNDGVELVKIMPPTKEGGEDRHTRIQAGQKVTVCNNMKDFNGDINYAFYRREVEKLTCMELVNEHCSV